MTGNSGGAVAPTLGNINTIGSGSITVVGSPGTSTLTTQLTGLTNHDVLVGAGTATITSVSPSTAGFVLTSNGVAADPSFQSASASGAVTTVTGNSGGPEVPLLGNFNILGSGNITVAGSANTETVQLTGLTNHSVQVGAGTATLTQLAVGTNGQVLVGATGADPAFATLTSSDSSISFTTGANTLSLQVAGGTTSIKTITGNSGGAESPSSGNFNIIGTGSITVAGSANTETVQLTGLTNHALQVGAGTATLTQLGAGTTGQVLQTNTGADPTWSTATYPSTTTINDILFSSSNNVVGQITAANNGTLISGTTGVPSWLANGTTGQLLTATTGSPPSWASPATSGTVTSVSGTANQVAVANGTTTPVISLIGPYTPATYTAHGVLLGEGTSSIVATAVGTTGQVLTGVTGADPVWASPATSGTVTSVSVVSANGFAGTVATATTTPAITLTTSQTGLLSGNGTAITGTAITQYNVLTAGASNAPNNVAPSATSGVPLISQGSSAQPVFGTAVVAGGGTGVATLTGLALGSGTSAFTGVTYVASTSWTPTVSFGGGSTGLTYTVQSGVYQRIGSLVFFTLDITLNSKGSSTGQMAIGGWPVAQAGTAGSHFLASWGGTTALGTYFWGALASSSMPIWQIVGTTQQIAALTDTNISNGQEFRMTGVYFV